MKTIEPTLIKIKPFLKCWILFPLIILANAVSFAQLKNKKPNVLIILTDDQGWGDLSFNKNPYLKTPAIDRIANEGASFNNFYVSPLCAPTRASLLTGRYHLRTGTVSVSKGLEIMNENETTIAELFAGNGYKTGMFGKWHNGSHYPNDPNGQGFQEFFGFCGGHWSNYFNTTYQHNQSFEKAAGYITDVLTSKAMEFIGNNYNTPFLCYLALNAPHTPHQVPGMYFNKYKNMGLSDEVAAVYGMCENADDNIGRIINKLKQLKIEENTIVVFMTDNGPNGQRFNGVLRGIKGSLYEGGIKVPCFISWAGKIKKNTHIDNLSQHIDIFPTLVDLCRLKYTPSHTPDGKSRAPFLMGEKVAETRNIYSHVSQPVIADSVDPLSGSVRDATYSLVLGRGPAELFNLITDPSQKINIAPQYPLQTETLRKEYLKWFYDCTKDYNPGRPIPLDGNSINLPAYEATFTGALKFKEGHGWVHDWLVNFGAKADTVTWDIMNRTEQKFTAYIDYAATEIEANIKMLLKINDSTRLSSVIIKTCNPPFIQSDDRVPRKEVYEREWCKYKVGDILLPAGRYKIQLITLEPGRKTTAEFNTLILVKIK